MPLTESVLQSMLGLTVEDPAPLPGEIEAAVKLLAQHRVGELQNHLSKLLAGQGMRKFLETTLIPLNEAVHERVVRGEMENFQELRFGDLVQRLLRDVTRLVRPQREAQHVLLATPPNDPNQLGLAILELLLFTEGVNCLTLGAGRTGAGNRRRGRGLQDEPRHPAVRPRHLGQDRGPGNPRAACRIAAGISARGQRAGGEPAGETHRRCADGRRFQHDHVDDARARSDASTGSAVAAAAVAPAGSDAGGLIFTHCDCMTARIHAAVAVASA